MTKSLHIALDDLQFERPWIIHAGEKSQPVHDKVDELPLSALPTLHREIGVA